MTNPYSLDDFIGQATKLTREAQNLTGVFAALLRPAVSGTLANATASAPISGLGRSDACKIQAKASAR
jgi:hypothetical protein